MQLNVEQKKIAHSEPNGHSLIKGVAGSGKTTVGICRIPFLLNNYCFTQDDYILFVTFNKTLIKYVDYLYKKIEKQSEYNSFLADNEKVVISTISSIMHKYYLDFIKINNLQYQIIETVKSREIIAEGISKLKKMYPKLNILHHKNVEFLLQEINWIKACNYMELEEYQNADRLGKTKTQEADKPQKLIKNSETRKAIFDLMQYYDKKAKEMGYISYYDTELIALEQIKNNVGQKYTHIIVDESQDLTKVQLMFLQKLYNPKDYSSITFIVDTAQSIYSHSWLVSGRSFTSIGFNMKGKSDSLSKNFRTTTQISEAAYSLIEKDIDIIDDENFVKPYLIDKQGKYPVYKIYKDDKSQANYIIEEIQNNLSSKYDYKDIAIIARLSNQLDDIKEILEAKGLKCELINREGANFDSKSIKLLTMHSAKGIEFKVVFIIGLNNTVIPYYSSNYKEEQNDEIGEKKLLYVGMTRSTELLYLISSSEKPSKFIKEINRKYLRLDNDCKLTRCHNIPRDNFLFKDKLPHINSNEEKIRQWVIKELMENYKYPEELINVEYEINIGSTKGFADIVVFISQDDKLIPYILIETKKFRSGLESGLKQLESYMTICKTCEYGVVTDGNEILIIDKDFQKKEDIPCFNKFMLPTGIKYLNYIDLKRNKNYKIIKNDEIPVELEVNNEGCIETYKKDGLKWLPVYGEIAAGQPLSMNQELEEEVYLPQEWFKGSEAFFILKVKGDSMAGEDMKYPIEDGDYVIIKQQNTANNFDIVVIAINDSGILKKYSKMGNHVLLISGNPKYEPIQISEEDVSIIGIAVGIIRKN